MHSDDDGADATEDGNGAEGTELEHEPEAAPEKVAELADACVRFVQKSVGVALDFGPDTLSILDHYVAVAANEAKGRPSALDLVARAVAAYFGEVVRRRYECWWHEMGDDVADWVLRFHRVFLTLSPYASACTALGIEPHEGVMEAGIVIEDAERDEIAAHLALSPEVTEEEFNLVTTRWDVLQIVVDQLKGRAQQRGLGETTYEDSDYEDA